MAHHVRRWASAFWGAPVMEAGVMPIRRSGAEPRCSSAIASKPTRCSAQPRFRGWRVIWRPKTVALNSCTNDEVQHECLQVWRSLDRVAEPRVHCDAPRHKHGLRPNRRSGLRGQATIGRRRHGSPGYRVRRGIRRPKASFSAVSPCQPLNVQFRVFLTNTTQLLCCVSLSGVKSSKIGADRG